MNNRKKEGKNEKEKIKIDYENIDVADIMDQIKKEISKNPKRPEWKAGKEEWEEAPGPKSKVRGLLVKLMKPFSPLIKLFILPVYEELRETVRILDQTNKRLDFIDSELKRLDVDLGKTMEYTKLLHNLVHNIVVEMSRLKIEEDNLRLKTRIMEKDFELLGKRERALEKHIFK